MPRPADLPDAAPAGGRACRNCGAAAPGHYCPNCGQETRIALPTFAAFMREAAGRYVALDGRMWRTLYSLVARPGFLTQEYFAGRRRRYIRPARLFLVLWLLLFATLGFVQSPADLSDELVFVDSRDGVAAKTARRAARRRDPRRNHRATGPRPAPATAPGRAPATPPTR